MRPNYATDFCATCTSHQQGEFCGDLEAWSLCNPSRMDYQLSHATKFCYRFLCNLHIPSVKGVLQGLEARSLCNPYRMDYQLSHATLSIHPTSGKGTSRYYQLSHATKFCYRFLCNLHIPSVKGVLQGLEARSLCNPYRMDYQLSHATGFGFVALSWRRK